MPSINLDEEKLRLAVSVAEFGILELDYVAGVAVLDERAASLLDLPAGVKISRERVHGRFHPDDQDMIETEVLRSLEAGGKGEFVLQHRVVRGDGSVRWLNVKKRIRFEQRDGRHVPISGMVAIADISDQKRTEDTFRRLIEKNPFGVQVIDADFKLRYGSEPGIKFFESAGQVIGRDLDELLRCVWPEEFSQHISSLIRHTLETGERYAHHNTTETRRDSGQTEAYDWRIERVMLPDGRNGVVCYYYDATEQKAFEQSLQEAKMVAEAANRSRGEFLANMSHEIRTPMAAIIGHADILHDHLKDPDNQQVVETIRRNGTFLLNILNDILDLSKIDAGKLEVEKQATRPDSIVGDVRSLMDVRASEKEVPLRIEFKGPIPATIQTDPVRLRQILLNLVGNAIKFTDEGEVRLAIGFDEQHNRLNFNVIDTGIGIPADKLNDLFEPFTQVDNTSTRSFGGTGLGLAICKRLAEALGGEVSVESEPGQGSQFTLSLEVAQGGELVEPNLNLKTMSAARPQELRLSANVLVVDDRRDIRYLAQHFIEKAGGEVVTATNGREAVDLMLSEEGKNIDAIVMDMQMPVMDGYEAATELRKQGCTTPIIALTANAMKSDRDDCLAAGCTDYTTKPLDSYKLVAMIDHLVS